MYVLLGRKTALTFQHFGMAAFHFSPDLAEGSGGVSSAQAQPGPAAPAVKNEGFLDPCDCCGQEEKVKGSRFGTECKKAVNNLTNREKKEAAVDPARVKRFEAVKKEGGPALYALIMAYRNQCQPSGGRGKARGNIDTMRVLETWSKEEFSQAGQRLLLMPLSRWLRDAQMDRGCPDVGLDRSAPTHEVRCPAPETPKKRVGPGLLQQNPGSSEKQPQNKGDKVEEDGPEKKRQGALCIWTQCLLSLKLVRVQGFDSMLCLCQAPGLRLGFWQEQASRTRSRQTCVPLLTLARL